jgi:hypothetical protein
MLRLLAAYLGKHYEGRHQFSGIRVKTGSALREGERESERARERESERVCASGAGWRGGGDRVI